MRLLLLILICAPFSLFSQEEPEFPDCWQEYRRENQPSSETAYCPLILCPDNSVVCFFEDEREIYRTANDWKRLSETKIEIGEDQMVFEILMDTGFDMILQSIDYPTFRIHFKKL